MFTSSLAMLLPMISQIILGSTLGFAAAVTPGPMQAYFLSQTIINGWRRTLPASFAPLITDGPIIVLVFLILTRVPTALLQWLQVLGGIFVIYLGWGAIRGYLTSFGTVSSNLDGGGHSLRGAVIMNMLNPNPYIFWSTLLGPILLDGWRRSPGMGVAFIMGFYATMIGISMVFIMMSDFVRHLGPRIMRISRGISGLVLILFGCYQLWSRFVD